MSDPTPWPDTTEDEPLPDWFAAEQDEAEKRMWSDPALRHVRDLSLVNFLTTQLRADAAIGRKVQHKERPADAPPAHRSIHPAAELWVKLTCRLVTRPRFQAMPDRKRTAAARREAARLIDAYYARRRPFLKMKVSPLAAGEDKEASTKFKNYREHFGISA